MVRHDRGLVRFAVPEEQRKAALSAVTYRSSDFDHGQPLGFSGRCYSGFAYASYTTLSLAAESLNPVRQSPDHGRATMAECNVGEYGYFYRKK
jgi:hypothetical protein